MIGERFYNRREKYEKEEYEDISLYGSEDRNFDGVIDASDRNRDVTADKSNISHYDLNRDGRVDIDDYER